MYDWKNCSGNLFLSGNRESPDSWVDHVTLRWKETSYPVVFPVHPTPQVSSFFIVLSFLCLDRDAESLTVSFGQGIGVVVGSWRKPQ